MKKENTSIRLRKIMSDNNMRQIDILNLTKPYCQKYNVKMNKSDISQYCSGKTEPNQEKLFVLSKALNVSESWLMGFDVSAERNTESPEVQSIYNVSCNTSDECELVLSYRKLSDFGRNKVLSYTNKVLDIESDELKVVAAHERTDIEVTDEMRQHDDDIMNDDSLW